jgi:phosphate-selective porin OprO/OprP
MLPRLSLGPCATWASLLFVLAGGPATGAGSDVVVTWKDGLRFGTEDGATQFRLGARVQSDWTFQKGEDELRRDLGSAAATLTDGTEFRRIYLEFEGVLEERTEVRAHVDFAGGKASARDVWVGLRKLPALGTVRVGHQYEPMGFDEQTSDRFLMFAERALPMALVPSRNAGILATNSAGLATWAAMIARETDDFGAGSGAGKYCATARLALAPWRDEEGRRLLHLGVSGSRRAPSGGVVQYSQRPENHLAPKLVDTGALPAESVDLVGLETAVVAGSFSAVGEWVYSALGTADQSDPRFSGGYVAGSFFLTGETRPYSKGSATFGRVQPREPWGKAGGSGAWEVGARFSTLDLDDRDAGVAGGRLDDVTVGLSWYANAYFRTTANWVRADLEDSGRSDALIVRFESNF